MFFSDIFRYVQRRLRLELSLLFTSQMRQNTLYCFTCHTSTMIRDQLVLQPIFLFQFSSLRGTTSLEELGGAKQSLIVIPAGKRRNSPPLFLEIFSRYSLPCKSGFRCLIRRWAQATTDLTTETLCYLHG